MRGFWFPDFQRNNPIMPPDWRWRRAVDLVATGHNASRKRDDEPTCRAVDFLRRLKRGATERTARQVTRRHSDISLALKFQKNPIRRLELECRVLARQSSAQIADVMGIPLHIIAAYVDLFYAIGERIDATVYIQHVIGIQLGTPAAAEAWMRWEAYRHGSAVIEPWLDFIQHQQEAHDLNTIEGWCRDAIAIFLAAKNLSLDGRPDREIVRNLQNLTRGWPETQIYRTAEAVFRGEMMRAVDGLPFAETEGARLQPSTRPDGPCRGAYTAPARRTRLVG